MYTHQLDWKHDITSTLQVKRDRELHFLTTTSPIILLSESSTCQTLLLQTLNCAHMEGAAQLDRPNWLCHPILPGLALMGGHAKRGEEDLGDDPSLLSHGPIFMKRAPIKRFTRPPPSQSLRGC